MSDHQPSTAFAVFEDRRRAHDAVERLTKAGFRQEDIGYIMAESDRIVEPPLMPPETKASEGAATGVATGGALGGLVGATVALAIPGVGPIIAGGLLFGALTGAVGGGIVGALVGLRIPQEHAHELERDFHLGKTIVTVQAGDRFDEATLILREAATAPEVVRRNPRPRQMSENDVSPGSGTVVPGGM